MFLHVLGVQPRPAQAPPANVAEVRLAVGVRLYVVGELQGSTEAAAAERALEAHGGMCQLVALERALLFEGFGTRGTLKGPRIRVQPLVPPQRAGEGEALPAISAGVGFLARVRPHVLGHVHVLGEALPAGGALEGALT